MKNKLTLSAIVSMFLLCASAHTLSNEKLPAPITRTSTVVNGSEVERTIILLDESTSREDLITTCAFLAHENVQLTFDKLTIGKSFLGIIGKNRIKIAKGQIKLANGLSQNFKAGGITNFKFIKIQYANNSATKSSQIEMIEIVD